MILRRMVPAQTPRTTCTLFFDVVNVALKEILKIVYLRKYINEAVILLKCS